MAVAFSSLYSSLSSLSLLPSRSPQPPPARNFFFLRPRKKLTSCAAITAASLTRLSPSAAEDFPECPALRYANVLFAKSSYYNVEVSVYDDETAEELVDRFRGEVLRARVIQECKRRRFYENSHDKKKRKAIDAAKRYRRRDL